MSERKRIFSEQEAADLLIKAAKLQEEQPNETTYTAGLTYDELMRMAKELGVDEKYLSQVLNQTVASGSQAEVKKWLGMVTKAELERVVDGELPPEKFDILMEELMLNDPIASTGMQNMIQQVGRSIQGKIRTKTGYASFQITSRNGRTRIKTKLQPFLNFFATFYPANIICLFPMIASANGKLSWLLTLGLLGGLNFLAWIGTRALTNKSLDALKERTDTLEQLIIKENANLRNNLENASNANESTAETHSTENA
ncbi:MAG: hypothetical protein KDC26_08660 [Armatimonadetes bacterium]|nr:hypothetical protein [Armatimonadota bacterium]